MKKKFLLCCVAGLLVACESRDAGTQDEEPADTAELGRRECPHALRDSLDPWSLAPQFADLNVPELHDCQRFIVRDLEAPQGPGGATRPELRYDSLFAIIAPRSSPTLEVFEHLEAETGRPGNVVQAVAAIIAYGDYESLTIKRGISCLYFWRAPSRDTHVFQWHAKVVLGDGQVSGPVACDQKGSPAELPGDEVLEVLQYEPPFPTGPDDYPRAARWDWDDRSKMQYMGVSCPDSGWCEVYRPPVNRSPTLWDRMGSPAGLPLRLKKILDIKGWYDHQMLATVQSALDADPVPTAIEGFVWPDTLLGTWDSAERFRDTTIRVGRVALFGDTTSNGVDFEKYSEKFGFVHTNTTGPYNTVFMCHEVTPRGCVPSGATVESSCACFQDPNDAADCTDTGWWAKVVPAGTQDTLYHGVCRYDMPGQEIPGTARWRWLADDDGTWFRCAVGCCEKTGEG